MDQSNKDLFVAYRLYRVKKINLVTELHMNSGAVTMVQSVPSSWYHPSRSLVIRWDLEGQHEMINHWSVLSVLLLLETPWCCPSKPHSAVPRNPCAAPRNPMVLCLETPGAPRLKTPGDKFWDQNFQVSVVFRPLRPKRAIPHPITIQNMVNNPSLRMVDEYKDSCLPPDVTVSPPSRIQ